MLNQQLKYCSHQESALPKIDPAQEALLDEQCILVDSNDNEIGHASKRVCHMKDGPGEKAPLHRAFSLFIFNSKNELLLQQRSDSKVTFPSLWTNTCCSHPLFVPSERQTRNGIGAKKAAQRKVLQELGIKAEDCPVEKMQYITRIEYSADSNQQWAENEIDYILFLKSHQEQISVEPNPNEVKNVCYVKKEDLHDFLCEAGGREAVTPWFYLMCNSFLPKWWENIDDLGHFVNHREIIRY